MDKWNINVLDNGQKITEDFLAGRDLPDPKTLSDSAREMFTLADNPIE
jgi:tRNA dimethylallyltransferase